MEKWIGCDRDMGTSNVVKRMWKTEYGVSWINGRPISKLGREKKSKGKKGKKDCKNA